MSTVIQPTQQQIVCRCLRVTAGEIETTVRLHGKRSLKGVMDATGAGTGCTACHCAIREMLGGQCPASSPSPTCVTK